MKFNWGTGIVLAFIGFIGFIMFFIIKMNTNDKYDHDLVTEKYYQKELQFQNAINKSKNSKALKQKITCKKTNEGLVVVFPEDFNPKNISGNITLYRPSNKKLDFETPISLSNNHTFLIPKNRLLEGRWNISVDWKYNEKEYLFEDNIIY